MSWMLKLCNTYDKVKNEDEKPAILYHEKKKAHIQITINSEGEFQEAKYKEREIWVPVTEESASRTSNVSPHPLSDQIKYIAKNHPKIGIDKKDYFESYKEQLKNWSEKFPHYQLKAIYQYIEKGDVVEDLKKNENTKEKSKDFTKT